MVKLREQPVVAALITVWAEPDQFDWITAFLRERGLLIWAQRMMSAVAASAAVIPLTGLVCERSPVAFFAAQSAGLILATTMAVLFITWWPSPWQSRTAVLLGLGCIAVWSQALKNHEQAVQICMAAAITGGYIAFFHGSRLMVINFIVALGLNAVTVFRLAEATEVMSAARAFWLIWLFNLAVPLSAWGAVRAIRAYVTRSNQDPLTGLLNRRAFTSAVLAELALGAFHADRHLIVVMIDLDNFKGVNDTYGHLTGDNTLIAVADLIRANTDPRAAVCRAGGEEFLIAFASNLAHPAAWTSQICRDIADLDPSVTASIGTVSAALTHAAQPANAEFIDQLVAHADDAMYTAKRNGGNQARHTTHKPTHLPWLHSPASVQEKT